MCSSSLFIIPDKSSETLRTNAEPTEWACGGYGKLSDAGGLVADLWTDLIFCYESLFCSVEMKLWSWGVFAWTRWTGGTVLMTSCGELGTCNWLIKNFFHYFFPIKSPVELNFGFDVHGVYRYIFENGVLQASDTLCKYWSF